MLALFGGWFASLWLKAGATIIKWLGLALIVLGVAFSIYRLIVLGERGRVASKALEVSRERRNLDKKIDGMPDSTVRDLLRAQQTRFKRQL